MKIERGLKCGVECHLWRSGLELAIYTKLAAVTWDKGEAKHGTYFSSIEIIAQLFGVPYNSAQRAVKSLVKSGWLVQVESTTGRTSARALKYETFKSKNYRVVTHKEWAANHKDRCYIAEPMPWDGEPKDALALALYRESQGKVRWYPNIIKALRGTGLSDHGIVTAWREYVASWDKEPWSPRGWQNKAFRFPSEIKARPKLVDQIL